MDTPTILIADDQQDVADALALVLKADGYRIDTVSSPVMVLDRLREARYDLALVDMNYARDTTSGSEGLRLLAAIQELDAAMPVIVITGWSTVRLAVQAMQRGACDFVPKPWDNAEVKATVRSQIQRGRAARQAARSQERRRADLEAAGRVQRRMLPESLPCLPGLECAATCRQAELVGGDHYDFLSLGEHRLVVTVGDIAGKGMAAGLLMATVQSLLRSLSLRQHGDPGGLVSALNAALLGCMPENRFATLFYGIFDDADGSFTYVSAGHTPPICVRADGSWERLASGGTMLGVFADASFTAASTTLHPGDCVVAFTDGLTEAADAAGEPFGDERIAALIAQGPGLDAASIVDLLLRARDEFAGADPDGDDTTIVALRARAAT